MGKLTRSEEEAGDRARASIHRLLEERDISQAEFARAMGLTPPLLTMFLKRRIKTCKFADEAARYFNVPRETIDGLPSTVSNPLLGCDETSTGWKVSANPRGEVRVQVDMVLDGIKAGKLVELLRQLSTERGHLSPRHAATRTPRG